MSAYDVLDALRDGRARLAPTTIYRALASLVDAGVVHRLESCNAFVACRKHCADEATIFSICDACGCVEETVSREVSTALSKAASATGFAASRHVIELLGRCSACAPAEGRA